MEKCKVFCFSCFKNSNYKKEEIETIVICQHCNKEIVLQDKNIHGSWL